MRRYVLSAACAIALGLTSAWVVRSALAPPAPAVSIEIQSPQPSAEGMVTARPNEVVDVTLMVRNTGREAIRGLLGKTSCQCQVSQDLPDTLAVGDSALFQVQLPAPAVGWSRPTVNLYSDDGRVGLISKTVEIHVPFTPRTWLRDVAQVSSTRVHGEPIEERFTLQALERSGEPCWIESASLDTSEAGTAGLATSERVYSEEEGAVIRDYAVSIRLADQSIGEHKGLVLLKASESDEPVLAVSYQIMVVSPISIVPKAIDLDFGDESAPDATVTLVFRTAEKSLEAKYDSSLLNVTPLPEAGRHAYRIQPLKRPTEAVETSVEFSDGQVDADVRLAVRIIP